MSQKISFFDQIGKNKRNSVILFLIIIAVLMSIGYLFARIYSGYFFIIMAGFSAFSIFYIWLMYYFSSNIALASVRAKPASERDYRQYHALVEGLALASGTPKPKLYIMENEMINAFASGRSPQHAVICVTTGALQKLNKQELEGVLAHELSHIKNYDIRFMTFVAVAVGLISIASQMFLRSLYLGGMSNRDERGNFYLIIIGMVIAILAPIVVMLVQLAISRKREFMADASSVQFTRYPPGLISALNKIKNDKPVKVAGALAPLFFSNPMKKVSGLLQTHPPLDERIKVLKAMG